MAAWGGCPELLRKTMRTTALDCWKSVGCCLIVLLCCVCSVLLRAGVITLAVVNAVFPWLDSPAANLRTMATSFFAEVRRKVGKGGLRAVAFGNCCLGRVFLQDDPSRARPVRAGIHAHCYSHMVSGQDRCIGADGHVALL